MAEENKVETTDTENKVDESKQNEEGNDSQHSSSQIDYEAELAKERERAEKAEKALAEKAFKERQQKRTEKDEEDEVEEEKPLTRKELSEFLTKQAEATRKELNSEKIASIAKQISTNDSEAALIVEIHKNRSFPADMPLQEQIEEAKLIANKKSLLGKESELKRALQAKETASKNSAGTHRDSAAVDEPRISESDVSALKSAGFTWDGKTRLYTKEVKGGKRMLTYDPKSKVRKVVEK